MSKHLHDEHDLGLAHDLAAMARRAQERRHVMRWLLSGSAAALLASCGGSGDSDTTSSDSGSGSGSGTGSGSGDDSGDGTCVANAEETAGPYPADGSNTVNGMVSNVLTESGVVRSDIRSSFGSSTNTAPGVPVTLTLSLVNSNDSCSPLVGYAVYLWHCTRDGQYSLYSSAIQDENYLRGVQVSDDNGQVTFQTIFPGCYSGRYPHIHFEIYPGLDWATLYTNKVLTSQIALPRDICSTVYGSAEGYDASVSNLAGVTIDSDNVFGDNTEAQIEAMTATLAGSVSSGYEGSLVIGVAA